ncbi:aldo/keto reductase [Cytobacillus dafuensis]|uniref:Aryl-alcohol dehydrogenase n=1 Tax=Cytobacillus dafuensis TaxID=1742359 RepID=A0A5B8ZCF6_CYTDA|nr:aldo/keto reductase [Cytobacillus dafuensis]QED49196.1 aryl-alcohol dehydrogenase [Cytobacillus dafuensis]
MKLSLGTVQFGLNYGITNHSGMTPAEEVKEILDYAKENSINHLDTAPSYGNSEQVIGNLINHDFIINTKTPHFNSCEIGEQDIDVLENTFFQSLKNLKQTCLEGIYIHNIHDMRKKNAEKLFQKLESLKKQGYVRKIGFSVYDGEDIGFLLKYYDFDLVQIPINIFDQRFLVNNYLVELKNRKIEIHARSIFLQGILLSQIKELPPHFTNNTAIFKKYENFLKENQLTKLDGAIHFVNNIKEIDYMIVGVNHVQQLKEILESYNKKIVIEDDVHLLSINNPDLIDPRRW